MHNSSNTRASVHQEQPRTENGAGFSYMSRGARHGLPEESGTGSVNEGLGAAAPQGGGGATRAQPPVHGLGSDHRCRGDQSRLRPSRQRGASSRLGEADGAT
jgi:hypothetical protein